MTMTKLGLTKWALIGTTVNANKGASVSYLNCFTDLLIFLTAVKSSSVAGQISNVGV